MRRVKYYVGAGNNSAMIKGLMKRRFWWVSSEDPDECCFVWTQIKVNSIYQKQQSGTKKTNKVVEEQYSLTSRGKET